MGLSDEDLSPRGSDQESYERLDALWIGVLRHHDDPYVLSDLIVLHIGDVMPGWGTHPDPAFLRPPSDPSLLRDWVRDVLLSELDTVLSTIAENSCEADAGHDRWMLHITHAKEIVKLWAAARVN
ncbi:MAG TPA: hypothetical protein VJ851_10660 [Jatrophihabitans sp.]|nr:hypothetical protein [Jatrophihabitans sp.]